MGSREGRGTVRRVGFSAWERFRVSSETVWSAPSTLPAPSALPASLPIFREQIRLP